MAFENFEVPDDASELFETVVITMPTAMFENDRARARRFRKSVPEMYYRGLITYLEADHPGRELIIRDHQAETETIIRFKDL